MNEILSQEDIDNLLAAISSGAAVPEIAKEQPKTKVELKRGKNVKVYDFKRPDKVSKDQLRTLQMIHETFARLVTTSLSAQLRLLVHVHVASADQLTYEEFIRSLPTPTTLAIINMEPLKGSTILEIDPTLTFCIIDRLFGGKGETIKIQRELTDIERTVVEGVIVRMLGSLREAWTNVIDLRPRLANVETNPQFAQLVPPTDMVVLVTFDVRIGEVEGMMNFCIPYLTIEPIMPKLSAQYWYSGIKKTTSKEHLELIKQTLEETQLEVTVELGSTSITPREVLNLQVGDIIKLDNKYDSLVSVKIVGREKFKGKPGKVGSKMAVQIVKVIEKITPEMFELILRESEE